MSKPDLIVLFEHPEWQVPLFDGLTRRGVRFEPLDLKQNAFRYDDVSIEPLYFNQSSPSAYVRGNTRAVPYAVSFIRNVELAGGRVINGSKALGIELSKSAQAALLTKLGLQTPLSIPFNDVDALDRRTRHADWQWPALLKPEQGGSGARMFLVESIAEVRQLLATQPDLWLPDNLLLLQQRIPYDTERGIVRMEFIDGELLYAMRVVSHGGFNLCPSETCNPEDGEGGACALPIAAAPTRPVEFFPYPEVSQVAVEAGRRIVRAAGIDVGGIEYIERDEGPCFYDINANSNLRAPIGRAFGFDPFERVVDYLIAQIALQRK